MDSEQERCKTWLDLMLYRLQRGAQQRLSDGLPPHASISSNFMSVTCHHMRFSAVFREHIYPSFLSRSLVRSPWTCSYIITRGYMSLLIRNICDQSSYFGWCKKQHTLNLFGFHSYHAELYTVSQERLTLQFKFSTVKKSIPIKFCTQYHDTKFHCNML